MRSKASQITQGSLLDRLAKIPNISQRRRNIVSPKLCDDVIQRLAPSLTQHVGCTIIDINPGIGLWSSKLHDYLKPRSHILMEPKQNIYLPFLQPLLDAPGSRYRLENWPDSQVWLPKRYIEEGLLHDIKGYGDPLSTNGEANNSVLIIANLAGQTSKMRELSRAATSAHLKAIDFSHDVRHKTGFQQYGPTRMLMWLSDEDKRPLLPRTVGYRTKLSVFMEANVALEEIVGSRRKSVVRIRREDFLESQSRKEVAIRMQEEGMSIPMGRQPGPEDRRSDVSQIFRPRDSELQELEAVMKKQEKIDEMDSDLYREGVKASEQENIVKALESRTQDFKADLEKMTIKQVSRLFFRDDDRRAFAMDPPLLLWDRRKAEPLLAGEDEFYAPDQMALLDFQPREADEFPMTPEQSIYFDLISSSLFSPGKQATFRLLDTIASGAFDALVPQVPAIHNPQRGGRRDIDSLRVRTATPEMIHGLAVAWDEWLFKPPIEDLLLRFGVNSEARAESKRGTIASL